ncbi:MAG: energy-coupling factor ABC transporter ATP-binding protein [Chloroflexia bacterium]|nr:energy-coupling factor ABC transporter ATP-binding protein [Chloroflexia bacterium]
MLVLRNVHFSYNDVDRQIHDVSLSVQHGEFVVLTGVSGCGKTSLTRLINGLIPHFYEGTLSGEVLIAGRNAAEMASWEFGLMVGSVFQDPRSQFFASMVQDEIAFGCENYGLPSAEIQRRLDEAAQELAVIPLLDRNLYRLSNGEKQKVAVTAVRALRPQIYVLDEPSANLDAEATQALQLILSRLKASGHTIVVAEHRLHYLMELADRILYMRDGRIVEAFTPSELRQLPHKRLAALGLRSPTAVAWHPHHQPSSDDRAAALAVQGLTVSVGRAQQPLLLDLSFALRAGEVVALTGVNGVGKSTLARVICGLARERRGQVHFYGRSVKPAQRSRYAWFVMQDTDAQLFAEDVLSELTLGKKATPTLLAQAEYILKELGLWQYRERHPASLSGGQKQRLTIAVALAQDTEILIFDEPTSGLDAENMQRVAALIRTSAGHGKAVLVITHDEEFIAHSCSRVMRLEAGRVGQDVHLAQQFAQGSELFTPRPDPL